MNFANADTLTPIMNKRRSEATGAWGVGVRSQAPDPAHHYSSRKNLTCSDRQTEETRLLVVR